MRTAEVCCLDIVYMAEEEATTSTPPYTVLGADGLAETVHHEPGAEVLVRRHARRGEIVELSDAEWERLVALEAVREPGSGSPQADGGVLPPGKSLAAGWEAWEEDVKAPFNAETAEAAVKVERAARENRAA